MANKTHAPAITLESIGQKLKTAREKKDVTIDQAQRQTHIHATVLTALECGKSDEVLTPTYVKSFLKKYSAYLGLDPNQIVKEYLSLHPGIESPTINLSSTGDGLMKSRGLAVYMKFLGKAAIVLTAIFLAVVLVKGIVGRVGTGRKPAPRKILSPVKQKALPVKQVQKKETEKANPLQIVIPQNEPITLTMKIKEQVYVGVKKDGIVLFKRSLPKGTVETFTADQRLNISIAKARAAELILNGKPLGPVGKGSIKDLEITRKGIRVK